MTEPSSAPPAESPNALLASEQRHRSLWGDAMRRLRRNPGSMAGLALLLIIIAAAYLHPT